MELFVNMISDQNIPMCELKEIDEKDIPLLYSMLKENVETPNASVSDNPLPDFIDSENFVKKFLYNNEYHPYEKWYLIVSQNKIVGNIYIDKKNYLGYLILKKYQNQGFAKSSIQEIMKKNPKPRFFLQINNKNKISIHLAEKFGFKPKATVFEKTL